MKQDIPDYEPLALKGAGTFGYVIEAYDRINGIRIAIKRTPKLTNQLGREYEILLNIKDCKYIVVIWFIKE